MSNQKELLFKINELKKLYNILCTMGPFDPQLYGVKFISITQLFNTPLDKLTLLISSSDQDIVIKKKIKYSLIFNNIEKQAPNIDIDILKKYCQNLFRNWIISINCPMIKDRDYYAS